MSHQQTNFLLIYSSGRNSIWRTRKCWQDQFHNLSSLIISFSRITVMGCYCSCMSYCRCIVCNIHSFPGSVDRIVKWSMFICSFDIKRTDNMIMTKYTQHMAIPESMAINGFFRSLPKTQLTWGRHANVWLLRDNSFLGIQMFCGANKAYQNH